jgi:hypothetical protein
MHLDSEIHRPRRPRGSFRRRKTSKTGEMKDRRYAVDAVDTRPLTGDTIVGYRLYETPANEDFTVGAGDAGGT